MSVFTELTTQRCAPPLQDDSSLSALTGVGLQRVAQALVGVGPACAEVVHAGPVPRLRRHHAVAGLKGGRFQHLAASVSTLLSLVACVFAGVDVLAGATRRERAASVRDLKRQNQVSQSRLTPPVLPSYRAGGGRVCLPSSCCQSQPLIG